MFPAFKSTDHRGNRRTYRGIQCEPIESKHDPDALQLWKRFAVDPEAGDWAIIRDHLRDVVCSGNAEHFDYLLKFYSWVAQHPGERAEVALVLKGPEGAGKGLAVRALLLLFGEHGLQAVSPEQVVGKFNSHLASCLLLHCDEALFAADPRIVGRLKGMVTEEMVLIEGKGRDIVPCRNRLTLILTSNEEWSIPAGPGSRRWAVFLVSDKRVGDRAYFNALGAAVDDPKVQAAMLHDLLAMDLSGFEIRDYPTTDELRNQRQLSAAPTRQWLQSLLMVGEIFDANLRSTRTLNAWESVATLHGSYTEWCTRHHRHSEHINVFGKALREVFDYQKEPMDEVRGRKPLHSKQEDLRRSDRREGYRLGTLKWARERFEERTDFACDWGGQIPLSAPRSQGRHPDTRVGGTSDADDDV